MTFYKYLADSVRLPAERTDQKQQLCCVFDRSERQQRVTIIIAAAVHPHLLLPPTYYFMLITFLFNIFLIFIHSFIYFFPIFKTFLNPESELKVSKEKKDKKYLLLFWKK